MDSLIKYEEKNFCGKVIRRRTTDGYLNATDMCKASKRLFGHWNSLDSTKEYLKELSNETGYPILQLVEVRKGNSKKYQQGTWIHPYVAINLAQWISPLFSAKISKWVVEWCSYSKENDERFHKALSELKPSKSSTLEKEIQNILKLEFNARVEVETLAGFIDLETEEKIIEIKEISKWKHAIGQIMSYGTFSEKKKCIYLFGDKESVNLEVIYKVCSGLDIEVLLD